MKKKDLRSMKPQALKKRLMASLSMLLIATLMMSTTTFAWFVLSTAPEVTGIETQVGANGSLEIALLDKNTRADLSTIRAGLGGGSLQENQISANKAWGNLIDLSYTEYGLGELTLLPARLDASANGSSYAVDLNKLLAVPNYGYDGRIIELTHDTASAIFQDTDFLYSGAQDYGVRAIGTSDALSPQGSALSSAKSNISTWRSSAKKGAQSALTNNMEGLFAIIIEHSGSDKYDDTHKATLEAMLSDLDGVLNYIENSLRQGLVAYSASKLSDVTVFEQARTKILNSDNSLESLISEVEGVPEEFSTWVAKLSTMRNNHGLAVSACAELSGNDYTWEQIRGVMAYVLNTDKLLINGKTTIDPNDLMTADMIEMTLAPGSGLFADVADFTGNYTVSANYAGKAVEMSTTSTVNPDYLQTLSDAVNTLSPADGGDESTALPLTATYGYAIDLAFRCNAAEPDLVLQTAGVQRVYSGDDFDEEDLSGSTQGGGSYMEFSSLDENFTLEQQLALMDAIRVGFVDDQGGILAIAKLNVTSKEVEGEKVKAPLYLYDYKFVKDEMSDGMILEMGQRRFIDNRITALEQNVAKAVTAVVWLDGDIVDNTMVSATKATSLDGVLNLQFATSAELVAATEDSVMNYTADQSGLAKAKLAADELYNEGQGNYTNVSWKAFVNAYKRAKDVNENARASQIEIRNAVDTLAEATLGLEKVSAEALAAKALEVRKTVGTDAEMVGAYVIDEGKDGFVAKTEGSEADIAGWKAKNEGTINSVNHELNKNDEGNGVYTAVYTDETWNALADALYQAEAVAMNENATEDQIDSALTALDAAEKALEHAAYYIPYEYNGDLFYKAVRKAETDKDTYGNWYDASLKPVYADVTILKLDAYAKAASIAQIGQEADITNDLGQITPDIAFLQQVYPELRDVEVKAVHWDEVDTYYFTRTSSDPVNQPSGEKIDLSDFSSADFVYVVDFPGITLNMTGNTGTTTLGATILTKDGVVTKVSKQITIYDAADAVEVEKGGQSVDALTVKAGETVDVSAVLVGGTEKIKSCTWASTDTTVATVSGGENATITGVTAGSTTIKVTVVTSCNRNLTTDVQLTVTE